MTASYQRFAGICGVIAGASGLLYLVFFLAYRNPASLPSALALLAVGLFVAPLLVGIYQHLRSIDEGFALLGLLLGIGGAGGAAVHAAFDLTNALHPPAAPFSYANPVDPRGFLTFAAAGLALLFFAGLITRSGILPRELGYLGWVSGALLIALYVAYLVALNPANPLVLALIFASGIAQPAWYLWAGWRVWQGEARARRRVPAARGRGK